VDPLARKFEVAARDGSARSGRLATAHGALDTPAFLPVGTHGAVRGLAPAELLEVGVQGLLANTYHLHLRPGEEVIARLGGLHAFMGWSGPILTDSGGYQIHSLDHLCQRSEEGVRFKSPLDGSTRFLTPERAVEIQAALGADLVVTLDEFDPIPGVPGADDAPRARELCERTLRWARRSREAHRRDDQLLFGIVQGGGFPELRAESASRTAELGFAAFAIGGLGVGEPAALRRELLGAAVAPLPPEAPRYLMGLGTPQDLIAAAAQGVDLLDCVLPTRHGRHGVAFTRQGRLALRNARFREDPAPLDSDCACPVCARFSRAYLRHLVVSQEMLGARLLSLHNLAHYMKLLADLREAVRAGRFETFARERLADYAAEPSPPATDSAA
jgi:queuine tRNA-ribosyltransferase